MTNYLQHLLLSGKRFAFLLLLYTLSRLFFFLLNTAYFSEVTFLHLFIAFLAGIRFDIAAIAFTNIIFLLFLLPGNYKNTRTAQTIYMVLFIIINSSALLGNMADARFFEFINKRSTASVLSMFSNDTGMFLLLPRFLADYWYVALFWLLMVFALWRWLPQLKDTPVKSRTTPAQVVYQSSLFLLISALTVLGARGTGLKPISIIDAASYCELKLVPLVINTPFSLIKTVGANELAPLNYFSDEAITQIYNPVHHPDNAEPFTQKNVVILILESFSTEYCGFLNNGHGYTPHLDSILSKSLVFENSYANGTQSYEAMPAIIAGMPSLMDQPYSGSGYAGNVIESLPLLLKRMNYHTSFFHGGNNGTMGFSNFAGVAGIDHYYGRNEYNNDNDFDGHWGIWDEPFLQFFATSLNSFQQPFFSSVFTLSSHHPYLVPAAYNGKFPKGPLPVLESIGYADHALGRFFSTASGMPWFRNTVFVITADHAAQAISEEYNTSEGMYRVPLAIFDPSGSLKPEISDAYSVQQIDIMPTVLEMLHYPDPYFAFGNNMTDTTDHHFAISYINGMYQLVEEPWVMRFDKEKVVEFYNYRKKKDTGIHNANADNAVRQKYHAMESRLKAIIQTYNNSLSANKTYVQPDAK